MSCIVGLLVGGLFFFLAWWMEGGKIRNSGGDVCERLNGRDGLRIYCLQWGRRERKVISIRFNGTYATAHTRRCYGREHAAIFFGFFCGPVSAAGGKSNMAQRYVFDSASVYTRCSHGRRNGRFWYLAAIFFFWNFFPFGRDDGIGNKFFGTKKQAQ